MCEKSKTAEKCPLSPEEIGFWWSVSVALGMLLISLPFSYSSLGAWGGVFFEFWTVYPTVLAATSALFVGFIGLAVARDIESQRHGGRWGQGIIWGGKALQRWRGRMERWDMGWWSLLGVAGLAVGSWYLYGWGDEIWLVCFLAGITLGGINRGINKTTSEL